MARSEGNPRLSELVDIGLFKRVNRSYYELTAASEANLSGELDPDELQLTVGNQRSLGLLQRVPDACKHNSDEG